MKKKLLCIAKLMISASFLLGIFGCADSSDGGGTGAIFPEMVKISGGTIDDLTIGDFYIGKYEVTQEEYRSIMSGQTVLARNEEYPSDYKRYTFKLNAEPSYHDDEPYRGEVQSKRPVENMGVYECMWFCNELSKKKGLTPVYEINVRSMKKTAGFYWEGEERKYHIYEADVDVNWEADGYRLPTTKEWEYAARGGNPELPDWDYDYSGSNSFSKVGWFSDYGDDETHQVGKKSPNRLGLYDMSGNVSELCCDSELCYNYEYDYYYDGWESYEMGASASAWESSSDGKLKDSKRGASYISNNGEHYRGFRIVRSIKNAENSGSSL